MLKSDGQKNVRERHRIGKMIVVLNKMKDSYQIIVDWCLRWACFYSIFLPEDSSWFYWLKDAGLAGVQTMAEVS